MAITGIMSNQSSSGAYQSVSYLELNRKNIQVFEAAISHRQCLQKKKIAKYEQKADFKSITYLKDKYNEGNFQEYTKENCVVRLGLHLGIDRFSVS